MPCPKVRLRALQSPDVQTTIRLVPCEVRNGSNPALGAFPLHVRSGAASGIPRGTARCRRSADFVAEKSSLPPGVRNLSNATSRRLLTRPLFPCVATGEARATEAPRSVAPPPGFRRRRGHRPRRTRRVGAPATQTAGQTTLSPRDCSGRCSALTPHCWKSYSDRLAGFSVRPEQNHEAIQAGAGHAQFPKASLVFEMAGQGKIH